MNQIQRNVDELKEQLERYSRRNPPPGSANPSLGSGSSPSDPGTSETPELSSTSILSA